MTKKDINYLKHLLNRTETLPDILHLRAAPIGYEKTEFDNKLLQETYQKLDDILKEVAAFINVKFPGRQDYIESWNRIDFDPKIGGIKVVTTNRELTKSAWKEGIFDLKSLIRSLLAESNLLAGLAFETAINPIFDEKEWQEYFDQKLNKRADRADFFLDLIIEKELINLDKQTIRKYFKQWFANHQKFDLQLKNGDLAIEDGDFQTVPDFSKDNIPQFLKWFEEESNNFIDYLKVQGVKIKKRAEESLVNNGNMIINNNTKIKKQIIENGVEKKESNWSKANVIIALVVGIATIIGILWQLFS